MEPDFSNTDAIAALSADKPTEFRAFVEHFQYSLFGFLGRMGFTQADAEDVAQDVFLKAWRYRGSYDPAKARVSTWLFTIARNTALSKLRGTKVSLVALDDVELKAELRADSRSEPEQVLQQQYQQNLLTKAIRQLPLDDRSAIALFYIGDLTAAQAATILQCSPNTFKTRLSRARDKLRAIVDELENTQ